MSKAYNRNASRVQPKQLNVEVADLNTQEIILYGDTFPIKQELANSKLFKWHAFDRKGWKTNVSNLSAVLTLLRGLNVNVNRVETVPKIIPPQPYNRSQPNSGSKSSGSTDSGQSNSNSSNSNGRTKQEVELVEYNDDNIILLGNTFPIKELIKSSKLFRWNNEEKGWVANKSKIPQILQLLKANNVLIYEPQPEPLLEDSNQLNNERFLFTIHSNPISFGDLIPENDWIIPEGNSTVVVSLTVILELIPENINIVWVSAYKRNNYVNADGRIFTNKAEAIEFLSSEYQRIENEDNDDTISESNLTEIYYRIGPHRTSNIVEGRAFILRAINLN